MPIINVLQDSPPSLISPNPPPLITLHNTPLASPGTVPSPVFYEYVATSGFAADAAANASSSHLSTSGVGDLTSCSGSLLRLPSVIKRYGRSHSAMTLPVIEISGESTASDRDDDSDVDDDEAPLSSSDLAMMVKGSSDACCAGSLLSPPKLTLIPQRHHHHHHHHHCPRHQQHVLHHRHSSSNTSLNPHHHHHHQQQQPVHSISSNHLEVVTNALLDKRSRSLSPGRCSCYNCNVSELIMQSRDLSPSERSNFRTYFVRSLSHKFYNCSCYSLAQQYESANSSYAASCCGEATHSSSPDSPCSEMPNSFLGHNHSQSPFKFGNHKRLRQVASRLARSASCPDYLLKPVIRTQNRQRSDSLDSTSSSSSSSPSVSSCSSKLHLSCSLDCLRTASMHENNCNCNCKRCYTPIVDAAASTAWDQEVDFGEGIGNSGCVDDTVLWLGQAQLRRRRQQLFCHVCRLKRHCDLDEPSQRFINNSLLRYHHPCTCAVGASCTTNYHHNHHNHHQRPFLHKLQQQRSFSSPDTRPSIIQPDPTCTARRHRHSISGQMSYFKLLGYNVSKKLTGSTNSLFSTAVISGSSSAPNLKDMVPPHASAVAGEYIYFILLPLLSFDLLHFNKGFSRLEPWP